MGRFATTWNLMKDAWGVLMRDKALMVFPVASGIACVLVLVLVILAITAIAMSHGHVLGAGGLLALLAVLYFLGLGIVMSTLRAIFEAVLYLFARTGKAPEGFVEADLRGAIKPA